MKAALLAIGNELLSGRILDYNSHWISKRLSSLGFYLRRIFVLPDEEAEIIDALEWCKEHDIDLVISTGGLGPTPGDITLESVAKFLGKKLVLDDLAKEMVKKRYKELYTLGFVKSPELNEARLKMAKIPEGCKPIYNDVGVAPAVLCKVEKMTILSLPGVPSEMMYLLEKSLPQILAERKKGPLTYEFTVLCGDESLMAKVISETLNKFKDVSLKTYPEGFGDQIRMKIIVEVKREYGRREDLEELVKNVKEFVESRVRKIGC